MARDNFTKKIVDTVAKRVGYICSNPACRQITIGPSEKDNTGHDHIGVAAHISAAAPGGPRFDQNLTSHERSSIENALYVCQNCAKFIDSNHGIDFTTELLLSWKKAAENEARETIRKPKQQQIGKVSIFRSDANVFDAKNKWQRLTGLFSEKMTEHLINQVTNPLRANIQRECPDVKRYVEEKFKLFGSYLNGKSAIELSNDLERVREILNCFIHDQNKESFIADWKKIGKYLITRSYFE